MESGHVSLGLPKSIVCDMEFLVFQNKTEILMAFWIEKFCTLYRFYVYKKEEIVFRTYKWFVFHDCGLTELTSIYVMNSASWSPVNNE